MATPQLPQAVVDHQMARIHENKGPAVIGVSAALTALSFVIVGLRFVARLKIKAPILADDWLCLPALLMIVLMCVQLGYSVTYGIGKHLVATDPTRTWEIMRIGFFLSITYSLVHLFIKMSILCFYIRVFGLTLRWFKIAVFTMITYSALWTVSMIIFVPLQCRPVAHFWNRYRITDHPLDGVCFTDPSAPPIATSVLNTLGDIIILLLPLFVLNQLQLQLKKKLALFSVFLVGAFACVAGIIRLSSIIMVVNINADVPWVTGDTYMWTSIEACVGLICACFPALWPLIRTFVGERSASSRYARSNSGNSGKRASNTIGVLSPTYQEGRRFPNRTSDIAPWYREAESYEKEKSSSDDVSIRPYENDSRV
ncbi:hypothetical protein P152DRAFT_469878 [Eremomyces bilateralis CBS 781.70]|uniref:Rhodopsin domain-containing protein n=1 Tax=Eremomyces bilateralis CBS 781.70 TaxID=1392243 RepID=A0A6G1GHU5_9PEZI|nr:uncharacterized protein P152DRAFT_469878 [Eremomyces bilateralis CBS 781.70]KAF1817440.1 hypothetical protein P152DRAFT_469878 [Eremomyces bilateralis CBS 781.70]